MALEILSQKYLPALEVELRSVINEINGTPYQQLKFMLNYHMGWEGKGAGPQSQGKRIRPLLLLLATNAAGGDWKSALPAAAAIELLHNFSLIHDDIEDKSPTRRNRPTLWQNWGVPQAINTGDALFSLAFVSMSSLDKYHSAEITLNVIRLFENTVLALTKGQFLDISFEDRDEVSIDEYMQMISGKTAALIGTSIEIGAILGNADAETQGAFRDFGTNLGLAFQIQDDYLGIWGDEKITGKSTATDIQEKKKTYPIIYGLNESESFRKLWNKDNFSENDVEQLARILEASGAREKTRADEEKYINQARTALTRAHPMGEAAVALQTLVDQLMNRSQ